MRERTEEVVLGRIDVDGFDEGDREIVAEVSPPRPAADPRREAAAARSYVSLAVPEGAVHEAGPVVLGEEDDVGEDEVADGAEEDECDEDGSGGERLEATLHGDVQRGELDAH